MKIRSHVTIARPRDPFEELDAFVSAQGLDESHGALLLDEHLVDNMELAIGTHIWAPTERPVGSASWAIRGVPERRGYDGVRLLLYGPEPAWGAPFNMAFALDRHPHPGMNYISREEYEYLAAATGGSVALSTTTHEEVRR